MKLKRILRKYSFNVASYNNNILNVLQSVKIELIFLKRRLVDNVKTCKPVVNQLFLPHLIISINNTFLNFNFSLV